MTMPASTLPLPGRPLLHALAKNWWLLLIRGLCAIIFGILTFIWPGITLLTLVLFYGAFVLATACSRSRQRSRAARTRRARWLIMLGLLSVAAGVLTFVWPGITALVLLLLIAGWSIAMGIMQIYGALKLRKEIDNEWWLVAGGVLSVLFGIILIVQPGAGALRLLW